jgi:hypothetical protein
MKSLTLAFGFLAFVGLQLFPQTGSTAPAQTSGTITLSEAPREGNVVRVLFSGPAAIEMADFVRFNHEMVCGVHPQNNDELACWFFLDQSGDARNGVGARGWIEPPFSAATTAKFNLVFDTSSNEPYFIEFAGNVAKAIETSGYFGKDLTCMKGRCGFTLGSGGTIETLK